MTSETQENSQVDLEQQSEAAPGAVTSEAKLAEELEVAQAALKEQQNKYLYLYAEFETFKKRAIKERSDLVKFGHESLSREMLQVVDNLDRALEHSSETGALVEGIKMVRQQLADTLAKFGVTEIKATGAKFDPELHEAVGQEKGGSDADEGKVLRELQKGYTINGRLLRPARVTVATK